MTNMLTGEITGREAKRVLLDLLCTIHRDGGQYISQNGLLKAIKDATTKIAFAVQNMDEEQFKEVQRLDAIGDKYEDEYEEKISILRIKDPECKGLVFRASRSHFYHEYIQPTRGYVVQSINLRLQLRLNRTESCDGCSRCGWMHDYLSEIGKDLPVDGIEDIEQGKLYRLCGKCTPPGPEESYGDFDEFYLVEVEEKKKI